MFGFGDKETPKVARRLFQRAMDLKERYLTVPFADAARLASTDFAEAERFISDREITFRDGGFPEFSFTIVGPNAPILDVHGVGRFSGFALQGAADGAWFTSIYKPIGGHQGEKAQKIATVFEKDLGVRNMEKLLSRHR